MRPRCSASSDAAVDLDRHVGELCLLDLGGGDRLAEHDPLLAVGERRLEAGAGRADRAPDDAEARLVQAGERAAQRGRLREQRVGRKPHVVEQQLGGDRRPERELPVDVLGA